MRAIIGAAALSVCLLLAPGIEATSIKKVAGSAGAGPNLTRADGWAAYEKGFARDGEILICDNGADAAGRRGATQTIVFNQKTPQAIIATAWSKADGVGGSRDSDYSLYLDLVYADGEPLWGQAAAFSVGTHDWERREVRVFPAKPVKSVTVNLLLRRHTGKAYFKGAELREVKTLPDMVMFDGVAVTPMAPPAPRFIVRDVPAGSDFVDFSSGEALGLKLSVDKSEKAGATFLSGRLADTTGKDRAVTLIYTLPVPGGMWHWLADPHRNVPALSPNEYLTAAHYGEVGMGRLSRYPLAAVAREGDGVAIALDMARPAFFRVGYNAASGELFIAYDLALPKEKPAAEFRFCTLRFNGLRGFRGAVAEMYRIFPEYFRSRTPRQGLWMPFHAISKVQGWEDFGFRFKEGDGEVPWDDMNEIITFRYTEPMTWWMPMPKGMPRTYDAALAEAKRLAEKGNTSAKALFTSGHRDADGRLVCFIRDEPWCNGAVWSMNSSPGIAGDVTDFRNKWSPALREKLYGSARKAELDGEYIDSIEGYVTADIDFSREHFGPARTPLVFSADGRRPGAFKGLIVYEYARAIADDMHGLGKLVMANGAPGNLCWLAPLMDVMGTETNWNPGGKWRPMSDEELIYRRVMCGPKPYCFLMNTNFEKWPYELTEKYMKRCLAYGMFPGFFSADASAKHYFNQPALYDRDRPLFKKYVPLIRRVAEAGWQPVPRGRAANLKVYVEQWGEKYLTLFNDSTEKQTTTLTMNDVPQWPGRELVRGGSVAWDRSNKKTTTLTLEPEDVMLIELP